MNSTWSALPLPLLLTRRLTSWPSGIVIRPHSGIRICLAVYACTMPHQALRVTDEAAASGPSEAQRLGEIFGVVPAEVKGPCFPVLLRRAVQPGRR
jgi:hypothetical protein